MSQARPAGAEQENGTPPAGTRPPGRARRFARAARRLVAGSAATVLASYPAEAAWHWLGQQMHWPLF
ncbi:hypothetical protein I6A84_29645 [Frankia sp. CNm7]|uniref:Uncharacterized protein n=1 Tax=Frankia nepalensis TaxID=1836974 RepID=A0A937RNU7_9ACTN|nr:hypothetical protein [Frankia nepalensis]MBL7502816.1 hypothetical protein [Frankia nepalensis]MBL7515271.1 hypothetical protein [Frankia nepalensis]MBL7522129.1 hypothetical protein [Frankia nepalensis]MBL7632290.1 hypothetical protein [Frankia nepalensis]